MSSDKPLPKRSDVECMTITIVGVLGPTKGVDVNAQLSAFVQAVEKAIYEHYPSFEPGHPPLTISVVSLPELRTPDA